MRSQGVQNPHWYVSSAHMHKHSIYQILEPLLAIMLGGAGYSTHSTRGRLCATHATIIVSPRGLQLMIIKGLPMDVASLRVLRNSPMNCDGEESKAFTVTSNYPNAPTLHNDSSSSTTYMAIVRARPPLNTRENTNLNMNKSILDRK